MTDNFPETTIRGVRVDWLLSRVAMIDQQRQSDGNVVVIPALRQQIINVLEWCLIDVDRLKLYMRCFQSRFGKEASYPELLDDAQLQAVLSNGLRVLDDRALIDLTLNPPALWSLYYLIIHFAEVEEIPHWAEVLIAESNA